MSLLEKLKAWFRGGDNERLQNAQADRDRDTQEGLGGPGGIASGESVDADEGLGGRHT